MIVPNNLAKYGYFYHMNPVRIDYITSSNQNITKPDKLSVYKYVNFKSQNTYCTKP